MSPTLDDWLSLALCIGLMLFLIYLPAICGGN